MVRLTGNEALDEACYAVRYSETLLNTTFYGEREGARFHLDPREVLDMVDRRVLKPEELSCEELSVWEHLERPTCATGFLHVRLGSRVVLVLAKDHGSRLAKRVRGFAVLSPVFGKAVRWAKNAPLTAPGLDRREFIGRLKPRLPLRRGEWQQNGDLRRHAREIAKALADLFGIDLESVRERFRAMKIVDGDSEQSYGGNLLDIVLERIETSSTKCVEECIPGTESPDPLACPEGADPG